VMVWEMGMEMRSDQQWRIEGKMSSAEIELDFRTSIFEKSSGRMRRKRENINECRMPN
jgi:hypothetical protein